MTPPDARAVRRGLGWRALRQPLEGNQQLLDRVLHAALAGELDVRRGGRLVRTVDAGEALELARPGLGVQALRVAPLALLERRRHPDLEERQALGLDECAGLVAVGRERRDQRL